MAARVRIFFVVGRGEHADGAEEEFVILIRCLFQLLDEFLDVAGHAVKCLGQFADFSGALHWSSLVKFTAADGQGGGGQRADRSTDADGKQVAQDQRSESYDDRS